MPSLCLGGGYVLCACIRSDKEKIVANLFASSGGSGAAGVGAAGISSKKKVLIEEVGAPQSSDDSGTDTPSSPSLQQGGAPKVLPVAPADEGPSLMEQMMEAQQQAKQKDDVVKAKLKAKEDKKALGGGFKKGKH